MRWRDYPFPGICRALAAWTLRWSLEAPDGVEVEILCRPRDDPGVLVYLTRAGDYDWIFVPAAKDTSDPGLLASHLDRRLDPIRRRLRPAYLPVLATEFPGLARAILRAHGRWSRDGPSAVSACMAMPPGSDLVLVTLEDLSAPGITFTLEILPESARRTLPGVGLALDACLDRGREALLRRIAEDAAQPEFSFGSGCSGA